MRRCACILPPLDSRPPCARTERVTNARGGACLFAALSAQAVRETISAASEAGGASADVSRLEAWTLSAALLSRVLHRFFQLDLAYFQVHAASRPCVDRHRRQTGAVSIASDIGPSVRPSFLPPFLLMFFFVLCFERLIWVIFRVLLFFCFCLPSIFV